jgi:hypothetical protein
MTEDQQLKDEPKDPDKQSKLPAKDILTQE